MAHRVLAGGGIERYTLEVVRHLAARHDVTLVTGRSTAAAIGSAEVREVGSGRAPEDTRGAASALAFPIRTLNVGRSGDYDAVYGPVGSVLRGDVVTAHSVHRAWVEHRRRTERGLTSAFYDWMALAVERATYRRGRPRITAVSPRCADDLSRWYGLDRSVITIVPPAVDTAVFRPVTRLPGEGVRPVVGTVANYAFHRKGLRELLRGCARVDATLAVAGRDPRRERWLADAARACGADLQLLGRVNDMPSFYGSLDAFVLASGHEAYGMAAHEAMACGVPTLVSQHCGIADLLGDLRAASTVDPADEDQLVEGLRRVVDPNVGARLRDDQLAWARARTWAHVGEEIEAQLAGVPSRDTPR